jgi:sulfite exporter TauE/SafE/copper chaperone CopZ
MSEIKKITIPVSGMHCRSCEMLIEDKLGEIPEVKKTTVDHKKGTVEVSYDLQKPNLREIEEAIREAGYAIGMQTKNKSFFSQNISDYKDLGIAVLFLAGIYVVLKNFGLTSLNFGGGANPSSLPVVFLVGVTAGLSTCMALVGGLILGISARHAEKHPEATAMQKFRPHLFFNFGRILSYAFLGGLLGSLGSFLQFSGVTIGVVTMLVGIAMLTLGLKLIGIFPILENSGFTLSKKIGRFFGLKNHEKEYSHRGSFLVGALTFFLPCGFTQTMQIFAIGTGSFVSGALIMGVFALGTAPGLLSIGGITSAVRGIFAKRFFRLAGLVVILFSLINISTGYNLTGWQVGSVAANKNVADGELSGSGFSGVCPMAGTGGANSGCGGGVVAGKTGDTGNSQINPEAQIVKTTYTLDKDIVPSTFIVKAGKPVRFEVDVKENGSGCMSTIMIPGLYDKAQYLQAGKTIIMDFTPTKPGSYKITCAMGVPRGTLTVE